MEQKWISVNDELPEIGVDVKVKIGCLGMKGTTYTERIGRVINEHGRFNVGFDLCRVVFWQPLPPKPTKEIK